MVRRVIGRLPGRGGAGGRRFAVAVRTARRAAQQRTGQAEAVELADRVGQAVEDPVDLRRFAGVHTEANAEAAAHRSRRRRRPGRSSRCTAHPPADISRRSRRASPGRCTASPCSSRQRPGSSGGSSWSRLKCAIRLIPRSRRHSSHTVELAGAQHRASGRQGRLAVQGGAEQPEDLGDSLCLRRAAGHPVVDLDDLVERLEQRDPGRAGGARPRAPS